MKEGKFTAVNCPHCGRELQIPVDAEKLVCMYCAQPIDACVLLGRLEKVPGETLETILAEVQRLVPDEIISRRLSLKEFTSKTYPDMFKEYTVALAPALSTYTRAAELDGPQAAECFSTFLFQRYEEQLLADGIKKESDARFFDFRYTLVALVIPALLDYCETTETLVDSFLTKWNAKYPKSPLGKSNYQSISNGFRKKWCFITTAVCESLNHPDNCYELNAFRRFRDEWLSTARDGGQKIREYYLFAPMIVQKIERSPRRTQIYRSIWENHLAPCLKEIECGQNEACAQRYETMVRKLEQEFLP